MIELIVFVVVVVVFLILLFAYVSIKLDIQNRRYMNIQSDIEHNRMVREFTVQDNRLAYEKRLKAFVDNNVEIIVK